MTPVTSTQLLNSLLRTMRDLFDSQEDEVVVDESPKALVMYAPPILGSTVTSQALNAWITQAIYKLPGSDFTTDNLATLTRVVAHIREPRHLSTFMYDEMGVRLLLAPAVSLELTADGRLDNSREVLRECVAAAAHRFYREHFSREDLSCFDDYDDFDAIATGLLEMTEGPVPAHSMVEVFQYWDLIPDATLPGWVDQYFLCTQVEANYHKQLLAQEAERVAAIEEAATKASSDGTVEPAARAETVSSSS